MRNRMTSCFNRLCGTNVRKCSQEANFRGIFYRRFPAMPDFRIGSRGRCGSRVCCRALFCGSGPFRNVRPWKCGAGRAVCGLAVASDCGRSRRRLVRGVAGGRLGEGRSCAAGGGSGIRQKSPLRREGTRIRRCAVRVRRLAGTGAGCGPRYLMMRSSWSIVRCSSASVTV